MAARRRHFGSIRKLPSGRYQARYIGPDGRTYTARTEDGRALTFDTEARADRWLSKISASIQAGTWTSPDAVRKAAPPILRDYAAAWMAGRDLADLTRDLYSDLLAKFIVPEFGGKPLPSITPVMVRTWYAGLGSRTGPTRRGHCYALLRTILGTAVADDVISANPCRIKGAGQAKRASKTQVATLAELETIVKAVPARYKLMILLAAWCAMRFGELAELRRSDVDLDTGTIRVRRAVVRPKSAATGRLVKGPKSDAGKRDVAIPPHLMQAVRDHLAGHTGEGPGALLFPARRDARRQMAPSTLHAVWRPAREAAGRPDLRFHDLRHTGSTLAAATGASLADLMARLGHSTVGASIRYQHAAKDAGPKIAAALSELAAANVRSISSAPTAVAKARADDLAGLRERFGDSHMIADDGAQFVAIRLADSAAVTAPDAADLARLLDAQQTAAGET